MEKGSQGQRVWQPRSKRQSGNAQFGFHLLDQHMQYASMYMYMCVFVCVCVCAVRAYLLVDFRAIKLLNLQHFPHTHTTLAMATALGWPQSNMLC